MSTRRGLAIVAILIVLVVAGAVVSARAQEPIACEGDLCVVPRAYLAELVKQARLVEQYAFMCGWTKEGR